MFHGKSLGDKAIYKVLHSQGCPRQRRHPSGFILILPHSTPGRTIEGSGVTGLYPVFISAIAPRAMAAMA